MYRSMIGRSGMPTCAIAVLFAGIAFCDVGMLSAQGPLRRLGERIRSRVEPLIQPPSVDPNGPTTANRPVAPYNAPNSSVEPRPSSLRPLRPIGEPNLAVGSPSKPDSPSIGIEVAEFNDGIRGVEVVEFQPTSRAAAAGLRQGDVIVGVQGRATASIAEIATQLSSFKPGDTVPVRVVTAESLAAAKAGRARLETRDLRIPLVSRSPESDSLATRRDFNTNRQVDTLRPTYGGAKSQAQYENPSGDARLGLAIQDVRGRQGAVVTSVEPQSPASVARIQTGDRIVSINGRVVSDAEGVTRAVNVSKPGDRLRLQWVRGEQLREANVTLAGPDGLARVDSAAENSKSDASATAARSSVEPRSDSIMGGLGSAIGGLFGGAKSDASLPKPNADNQGNVQPVQSLPGPAAAEPNNPLDDLAGPSILMRPVQPKSTNNSGRDSVRELPGPSIVAESEEMTLPIPVEDPLAFGDEEPIKRAGFNDTSKDDSSKAQSSTELPNPAQLSEPKSSKQIGDGTALPQPTAPTTLFKPATKLDGQSDPPSLSAIEPPVKGPFSVVSGAEQTILLLRSEIEKLRDRIRQLETAETPQ